MLASGGAVRSRMTSLWRALRVWPNGAGWRGVAIELIWALPLMAAIGWAGGLIGFDPVGAPASVLATLLLLFFAPALGEELLFRGALLDPGKPSLVGMIVAVSAFVLWHPLQAITFGPPWAGRFVDPWFLAVVAVLGIILSRIYLRTGSLWPCILVHWLVVAAWKFLLGGPF